MRVKTARSWSENVPIQHGFGEVGWMYGGLIALVTGERHSHQRTNDDERKQMVSNTDRQEDLAIPGLQGVD